MIFIALAVLLLVGWMAYDSGYDAGWWDGRYPERIDGEAHG